MILIDTSAVIAALSPKQRHHEPCARVLRAAAPPRILSPFVLAEVDFFAAKYGGIHSELLFLGEVSQGVYELASFSREDVNEATTVIETYRELNIGLADASIAVLAARYDTRDVFTLDERHFRAMRPMGRRSFRILPADA